MRVALLFVALLLSGCVTRPQIRAAAWLNNGLSVELCGESKEKSKHPDLWDHGFYRKLNSGKFEFMPFCNLKSHSWVSMSGEDFNRVMDGLAPEVPASD